MEASGRKSVPRGSYLEEVTDYEGTQISTTCWKDNKTVMLVSTYVGAEPVQSIRRLDKKSKKKVTLTCPKIVTEYNIHMGGVDLMDSYLGRYKIRVKSRKWYIRLFYHMLDMVVINSWLMYKKINEREGNSTMNLVEFRTELADTLCKLNTISSMKRGRPSHIDKMFQEKKQRGPMKPVPSKDVRTDGKDHHEERT